MDFRSMKRKELQVLCKKNKIPANLSNVEMANKLTEFFQEKKKPSTRGLMKEKDENKSGVEHSAVSHREAKKVRFSPEHELIEFTRSRENKRRSNRTSALGDNNLSVEKVDKAGCRKGNLDRPVRVTRLRGKLSMNSKVNSKKDRDDEEEVDIPRRITRSRGQKWVDSLVREEKRGEYNGIALGTRKSLRNRGVIDEGKLARNSGVTLTNVDKRSEHVVGNNEPSEENMVVARENLFRRSKKKPKVVDDSEVFKHDIKKHENDSSTCLRNTRKSVVVDGLEVEAESSSAKVDDPGKVESDFAIDEPLDLRSSRRKIQTVGVSENDRKVIQHAGVRTRSRYKSAKEKLETDTQTHDSEAGQELTKPAGHAKLKRSRGNPSKIKSLEVIDELGEDAEIPKKNQTRKRKRNRILGKSPAKPKNDTRPLTRSRKQTHENEKTVSASVINNFSDQANQPNSLKEPNLLEDSSHKGLPTIGEPLWKEAQLAVPDVAEGSKYSCAKKLTRNKQSKSTRKHRGEDKKIAGAVGVGMKSVNDSELSYLAEDQAFEISDMQTDCTQAERGISTSKLMDVGAIPVPLEVAEYKTVRNNISDDENSNPVVQVVSQSETVGRGQISGHQELLESSNIPGNESPDTTFSADCLVLADLEVTEVEVDDKVQSNSRILDHDQIKYISAEEDLETFAPINETTLSNSCHVEGPNHLEADNKVDMCLKMREANSEGLTNFTDSMSALEIKELASSKLRSSRKSDNFSKGAEFFDTSGIKSESKEAGELRNIKDLTITNDHNMDLGISNLFGERIAVTNSQDSEMCSSECSIEDSDKQGIFPEPLVMASTSMIANSPENDQSRSLDVYEVDGIDGTDVHKHEPLLQLTESKEKRRLVDHERLMDEASGLRVPTQFDCQRSTRDMPQDCVSCSGDCFIEESGGQGPFNNSQNATSRPMAVKCTVSKFNAGIPSLLEVNCFRSEAASKFEGSHAKIYAKCRSIEKDTEIPNSIEELEANSFGIELSGEQKSLIDQISIGENKILNQASENSDTGKYDPEQPHSSLVETIATRKGQEALSSLSETAGNIYITLGKTAGYIKTGVVIQVAEENVNDSECNKETDDFTDAQALDVSMSIDAIHRVNFENHGECKLLDAQEIENLTPNLMAHDLSNQDGELSDDAVSRSGKETHVNNLFGSPMDKVTPNEPKEASISGNDIANTAGPLANSTTYRGCWNFSEKKQEMEEASKYEDDVTTDKRLSWPTTNKYDYDIGSYIGNEEENTFAKSKSHENVKVYRDELENCSGLGNLVKAKGEDIGNQEINDVEVANIYSCAVVSENNDDGNEEKRIGSTGENIRESNSLTNEDVGFENEEVNEDVDCQVAKMYSNNILSEARYDDNEVRRTENTTVCIHDGNEETRIEDAGENIRESKSPTKEEVDFGKEEVNEDVGCQVAKKYSNNILSEAKCDDNEESRTDNMSEGKNDGNEKTRIGNTGENIRESNSLTKEEIDFGNKEVNEDVGCQVAKICSNSILSESKYDDIEENRTENTAECKDDGSEETRIGNTGENIIKSNSQTKEVDFENKEVNEDVGCQVANTYSNNILSEAKYDENEERRTRNTTDCQKQSHPITEENKEDIEVEGVSEVETVELENNLSFAVVSEAKFDCKVKQWIDNTSEYMKESNSLPEENKKDFRNHEVIEFESFEMESIFSNAGISVEAKYDAYEEHCIENTGECIKESNSVTGRHEEENICSGGQSFFDEAAIIYHSKSSDEKIISPGMKNSHEGDSDCFINYHKHIINSRETSVNTFEKHLNPEVANIGSFNGKTNVLMHKDSPPHLSLNVSYEDDEVTESKDLETTSDNIDLCGVKTDDILTYSNEVLDELHANTKTASSKSHFDHYTLKTNVLSCDDGIQKTCEKRVAPHHNVQSMLTIAEHESIFWNDESDMLQNLVTRLFSGENELPNESGDSKEPEAETSNFSKEGNQEADGSGSSQQFFMAEFHLEEKVDLKSDIRTISDSEFANESGNEIPKESHAANTIKEYVESEPSVPILDYCGADIHTDLDEPPRRIDERVTYTIDNDDKTSITAESKEPEESKLFLGVDEGFAVNDKLVGQKELNIKDGHSSAAKKNSRTILIHGTPNKHFQQQHIKENAPNTKRSHVGDYTSVRPTRKRRALQNVPWK